MNKLIILILAIFISAVSISAQERFMVYFKDKGINTAGSLNKTSIEYKEAEAALSKRAIDRRKKTMGENYITYEDLPINKNYIETVKNFGVEIHRELKWFNAVSCYLTEEQIKQIILLPFVDKIEKVRKIKRVEPEDKGNNDEGSLLRLRKSNYTYDYGTSLTQNELSDIPIVHDAGITGENVIIGILDTGFNWANHPALDNTFVVSEYDFIFDDSNTANEGDDAGNQHNHGTFVMSLIGGFDEGHLIGVSFDSKFVLAKTEDIRSETHVEEDNYAAALEWMENLGVDIATSSLGYQNFEGNEFSYTYADMDGKTTIVAKASNLAFDRGIITVTSAGNERTNVSWGGYINSPADAFNVITVGAVNSSKSLAYFSSHGPTSDGRIKPEVVAQGMSMTGASGTGYNTNGQGTSYSTPVVAGIAGLLKSAYSHLSNKQVREIIIASGDNQSNPNNDYGYGLVSAVRAINYPNIKLENSIYTLNKTFINKTIVDPSSVQIHYSINESDFASSILNYDGTLKYSFDINTVGEGDSIEFYFTYNNNGTEAREPSNTNYLLRVENLSITTIKDINNNVIPNEFELSQNYPNPFNPNTFIKYNIPQKSFVSLKIYDMLGREIKSLVNSEKEPSSYSVEWNGTNNFGERVASGAYVYQIVAGNFIQTKKMVYLK